MPRPLTASSFWIEPVRPFARTAAVFACVSLAMISCAGRSALAERREVRVANRAKLVAALGEARPGTTILLAPGVYAGDIFQEDLRGTAAEPIVLTSADLGNPARIRGGDVGIQLSSPQFVTLSELVFERQKIDGLNIDDGASFDFSARDVVLRNLVVRDVDPRGNHDAIKLSGVRDFRVEGCVAEGWGDDGCGVDMVGCTDMTIADCLFLGDGADTAAGVQAKGGSRNVDVRRCTFFHAGGRGVNIGGSTGLRFFRPGPRGYEAKDILVEDSTFVGCDAAVAFVNVDGAVVRYCSIYAPERWALRILQENRSDGFFPSRDGRFERNVVAFFSRNDGTTFEAANVGPSTAPETFEFARNVWYCLDRPNRTEGFVELPTEEVGGRYDAKPKFENAGDPDTRLRNAKQLRAGVRTAGANEESSL